jgi:hypothetical protein
VVGDLERRIVELRFIEGIEKAEHVPYPSGDQFWVRFSIPLDLKKLESLVSKHGYVMVRFANLPSKLPRGLSEMLWDGVTHVIAKRMNSWSKFTSSLGLEPEGIAKIADDLHGKYQIFIATAEEGVQLLYEYLGLKYVPPTPTPPVAPAKAPAPVGKPAPVAPRPVAPVPAAAAKAPPASQPAPHVSSPSQQSGQVPKPSIASTEENKKETTKG